jgi:hypothetical protein
VVAADVVDADQSREPFEIGTVLDLDLDRERGGGGGRTFTRCPDTGAKGPEDRDHQQQP